MKRTYDLFWIPAGKLLFFPMVYKHLFLAPQSALKSSLPCSSLCQPFHSLSLPAWAPTLQECMQPPFKLWKWEWNNDAHNSQELSFLFFRTLNHSSTFYSRKCSVFLIRNIPVIFSIYPCNVGGLFPPFFSTCPKGSISHDFFFFPPKGAYPSQSSLMQSSPEDVTGEKFTHYL